MCEILDFRLQVIGSENSRSVLRAASDKSLHAQGGKVCPATACLTVRPNPCPSSHNAAHCYGPDVGSFH